MHIICTSFQTDNHASTSPPRAIYICTVFSSHILRMNTACEMKNTMRIFNAHSSTARCQNYKSIKNQDNVKQKPLLLIMDAISNTLLSCHPTNSVKALKAKSTNKKHKQSTKIFFTLLCWYMQNIYTLQVKSLGVQKVACNENTKNATKKPIGGLSEMIIKNRNDIRCQHAQK